MPSYVLDASAVLCVLLNEPGSERVEAVLGEAIVGAVNLSEVASKLVERGVPAGDIEAVLADLDLSIIPFDRSQAMLAGRLRTATRSAGLSLGDRACLALAVERGAVAMTTDRSWTSLAAGAVVEMVQ